MEAFDGVHLEHQALIRATCRRADDFEIPSAAYKVDPPPHYYLEGTLVVTPLDKKLRRLANRAF
jgi:FAD synthase